MFPILECKVYRTDEGPEGQPLHDAVFLYDSSFEEAERLREITRCLRCGDEMVVRPARELQPFTIDQVMSSILDFSGGSNS